MYCFIFMYLRVLFQCFNVQQTFQCSCSTNVFFITTIKVQQRGIKATKDILLKLVDGLGSNSDATKVLVVDMVPSRLAFSNLWGDMFRLLQSFEFMGKICLDLPLFYLRPCCKILRMVASVLGASERVPAWRCGGVLQI